MQTLALADGRTLAFDYIGAGSDGTPVLFFHGTPGSHKLGYMAESEAKKHRFRLISPDRPGLGDSTFHADRELRHYPADIAALLDHLGIAKIGIVAISGGVPYAFQCAHDLPDRIAYIVALSGWVTYTRPEIREIKADRFMRVYGWCTRNLPFAAEAMSRHIGWMLDKHIDAVFDHMRSRLCADDQAILGQERYATLFKNDLKNVVKQGWQGGYHDGRLQFADHAFALTDVRQPVVLLHGDADTIAPVGFSDVLNDLLPNVVAYKRMPGGGHLCAVRALDFVFAEMRKLERQA